MISSIPLEVLFMSLGIVGVVLVIYGLMQVGKKK
jgi:hypothetical protein